MKKLYGPKNKHERVSYEKANQRKAQMEAKLMQFIPTVQN